MSTKPVTVPTWDSNSTHLAAPSAGHITDGYAANEVPASNELNGWQQLVGAWAQYLSDGAMSGDWTFAGKITLAAGKAVIADDFKNQAALQYHISAGDAATTATGPTWAANGNGWTISTTTGRLIYPVSLKTGDRITTFTVHANKISGAGTITARLYKYNANTLVETALGVGVTYAGSSGYIQLTESSLAIDVGSTLSEFFYIVFTGGGTTGDAVYHATVSATRP